MAKKQSKAELNKKTLCRRNLKAGFELLKKGNLFRNFDADDYIKTGEFWHHFEKTGAAVVKFEKSRYRWIPDEKIFLNENLLLKPEEWEYVIAHCLLHFAFGHFDAEKMPGFEDIDEKGERYWKVDCDTRLWNFACDIYISKFMSDLKLGKPLHDSIDAYLESTSDERVIYNYLINHRNFAEQFYFGTGSRGEADMLGLDKPIVYDASKNESNHFAAVFATQLARTVSRTVVEVGGHSIGDDKNTSPAVEAAQWFVNHYPLLGGLAAGFKIIENWEYCNRNEISIAAIDVPVAEIYVNPAAGLKRDELRFVLAHEFLHAGLQHHERCQGRDPYLWNIACDFVINDWLEQMQVGEMPAGVLHDKELRNQSAEEIYDRIVVDLKKYSKLLTLRGYGKGDIIAGNGKIRHAASLDDFYKSALQNGLEYHNQFGRGLIPAGLIEEIRALSMPPIPWDVELGKWFDVHFAPLDMRRTYARPSRRQGSTPDIPRPRLVVGNEARQDRTFGVVVDTSGSMNAKLLGYALGAIASYSAAKDVAAARVIFCDAEAYDEGYLAPEDIAGRIAVKGRGGTVLQPGVDLLLNAKDFPKDAPILIITDGWIEDDLKVRREHAFLIPRGRHLPFRAKGEVFYFEKAD